MAPAEDTWSKNWLDGCPNIRTNNELILFMQLRSLKPQSQTLLKDKEHETK